MSEDRWRRLCSAVLALRSLSASRAGSRAKA
jgi:hypothetical protein